MSFYDLGKNERAALAATIHNHIHRDLHTHHHENILLYFSDPDTYIRKTAYLAIGKIYLTHTIDFEHIINTLKTIFKNPDPKIRQTVVNAAGEIGKHDFPPVVAFFDTGLFDSHHSVRNAVIGSIKKMGEKSPIPILEWSRQYLHHPNKEIRREICHGIELRGRTHPQDILPLLRELQYDTTARVRSTLVHVLGQIAYKRGCLETVMKHLLTWENQPLVSDAIEEIIDVHHRYRNFSFYTQSEAKAYIYNVLHSFPQLRNIHSQQYFP